jgi:hypothetical protein
MSAPTEGDAGKRKQSEQHDGARPDAFMDNDADAHHRKHAKDQKRPIAGQYGEDRGERRQPIDTSLDAWFHPQNLLGSIVLLPRLFGLSGQERISVYVEGTGIFFTAGFAKCIDCIAELDFLEPGQL